MIRIPTGDTSIRSGRLDPFVMHYLEMRTSVAWRHLPNNARRVLDRLEVEHMHHSGRENGNLKVTYTSFAKAGIRRASIALAIRQAVALGFIRVTERGGRTITDQRWPSKYRLTYVDGRGNSTARSDE